MTSSSPRPAEKKAALPGVIARLPPEERFWQHYSPHHELPLSGVTSLALHALAVVLLLVIAWVAVKLGWQEANRPPEVIAVTVQGGGNGPRGPAGPGPDPAPNPKEFVPDPPEPSAARPDPKLPDLDPDKPPPLRFQIPSDPNGRPLPDNTDKALRDLQDIRRIFDGLGGKGPSGPGREGQGSGPGQGPGNGPGKGGLTKTQQRLLRWSMTFNTESGEDYLRQLRDIKPGTGAILAIPDGDGRYRVFRDLSQRPATGKVEDVASIQRIFWVDDRPESVAGLARALGLEKPPAFFVAFFPAELEEHLAELEKARLDKDFPRHTVDEIIDTRFEVVPSGKGYEAKVVSVALKKP